MPSSLPALRDFSDRLSPMVVKEMRQGLRTRFFTAALILFHLMLGCLMLALLRTANSRDAHEMFWLIIGLTLLGLLPARAFNALNAEVRSGTLDMLMLTGISSFRIVWGKWVSLYSQTLLIAGSLLPYMIVRYQMGGVEIIREVIALSVLVVGSGMVTAALTGFSFQKMPLVRYLTAAAVAAAAFVMGMFAYLVACEDYAAQDVVRGLLSGGALQASMICLGILLLAACITYQLLCLGSSRLAFMTDSHALTKRLVAFVILPVLVLTALIMALLGCKQGPTIAATFVPSMIILLLLSMDWVTEPVPPTDANTRRLLKAGWPSGVLGCAVLWLAPFLILTVDSTIIGRYSNSDEWIWYFTLAFMAATLAPVCIPLFRRQCLLAQWWLCQLLMLAVWIAFAVAMQVMFRWDDSMAGLLGVAFPLGSFFAPEMVPYTSRDSAFGIGIFANILWILFATLRALSHLGSQDGRPVISNTEPDA